MTTKSESELKLLEEVMKTFIGPKKENPIVQDWIAQFKQNEELDKAAVQSQSNQEDIGKKFDQNKLRWSLLPISAVEKIIQVLMYGSDKYSDFNWAKVSNRKERYVNAAMRHLTAYMRGEEKDPESGLEHLAHCACSLLFLLAESQGEDALEQMHLLLTKEKK